MNKPFFTRSWFRDPRIRRALLFVGTVFIILLLANTGPLRTVGQSVRNAGVSFGTSTGRVLRRLGIGADEWQTRAQLCEATLIKTSIEKSELEQIKKLAAELEEAAAYQSTVTGRALPAKILMRQSENARTLLIDRGSSDLIAAGQAVVVEGGHLIGVIQSVENHTSIVRLLSDSNSKIPATVLGQASQTGLIVGEDGYLLTLSFVPQDQPLQTGELVVTSGLEGWLPSGLVIGTVAEVAKEERAPFQTARVSPIVNADDFASVEVIDQTFVP